MTKKAKSVKLIIFNLWNYLMGNSFFRKYVYPSVDFASYNEALDESTDLKMTKGFLKKIDLIASDMQYLLKWKKLDINQVYFKKFDEDAQKLAAELFEKYYTRFWLKVPKIKITWKYNNLLSWDYYPQSSKYAENVLIMLYYISFYYLLKQYIWQNNVENLFEKKEFEINWDWYLKLFLEILDAKIQQVMPWFVDHPDQDSFAQNVQDTIRYLFMNLYLNSSDNNFKSLIFRILNTEWKFRIKTSASAVGKLLLDDDSFENFYYDWALYDIFWLNVSYDSFPELQSDAKLFMWSVHDRSSIDVIKHQDRWVLSVDHDNPSTLRTTPFMNVSLWLQNDKNMLVFWELSFRQSLRWELRDVLQSSTLVKLIEIPQKHIKQPWKDLCVQIPDIKRFWKSVLTVNDINHPLYKIVQTFRILEKTLNTDKWNYWWEKKIFHMLHEEIDWVVSEISNKLMSLIRSELYHIYWNIIGSRIDLDYWDWLLAINDIKVLREVCWEFIWSKCETWDKKNDIIKRAKNQLWITLSADKK